VSARRSALVGTRVLDQADHTQRDVLPVGAQRPPREARRGAVLDREALDVLRLHRDADRAQQILDRGDVRRVGCAARGDVGIGDPGGLRLGRRILRHAGRTAVPCRVGRLVGEQPVTVPPTRRVGPVGEDHLGTDRQRPRPDRGGRRVRRMPGVDPHACEVGLHDRLEPAPHRGGQRRSAAPDRCSDQLGGAHCAIVRRALRARGVAVECLAQRAGARPAPRGGVNGDVIVLDAPLRFGCPSRAAIAKVTDHAECSTVDSTESSPRRSRADNELGPARRPRETARSSPQQARRRNQVLTDSQAMQSRWM